MSFYISRVEQKMALNAPHKFAEVGDALYLLEKVRDKLGGEWEVRESADEATHQYIYQRDVVVTLPTMDTHPENAYVNSLIYATEIDENPRTAWERVQQKIKPYSPANVGARMDAAVLNTWAKLLDLDGDGKTS